MSTENRKFSDGDIVQIMALPVDLEEKFNAYRLVTGNDNVGKVSYAHSSEKIIRVRVYYGGESEYLISWPEEYLMHADFVHRLAFDLQDLKCDIYRMQSNDA